MGIEHLSGNIQQAIWRADLIRLTSAPAKGSVGGAAAYVDPHSIILVRRIPKDPEGTLEDEVTYVRVTGDGIYVQESPDQVFMKWKAAMNGGETGNLKAVE